MRLQINERIDRKREKLTGKIMRGPYRSEIGNNTIWVADIMLDQERTILYKVAIADYNFNLRYANEGLPVEVQKSNNGMYQITGRAEITKGIVKKTRYKPNAFFASLDGLIHITNNTFQTQLGNNINISNDNIINYEWQTRRLTLEELSPFGSKSFGAIVIERV